VFVLLVIVAVVLCTIFYTDVGEAAFEAWGTKASFKRPHQKSKDVDSITDVASPSDPAIPLEIELSQTVNVQPEQINYDDSLATTITSA